MKNERNRSANAFAFSKVRLTRTRRSQFSSAHCQAIARPVPPPAPIMTLEDRADRRRTRCGWRAKILHLSIGSDQPLIAKTNCVYGSYATCGFIRFVDLPKARDFVWHRQVHSYEVQISQKTQSRSQFIRSDMKTRVLSIRSRRLAGRHFAFRAKANAQRDRQRRPGESVDQRRALSHSTFQGRRAYNVGLSALSSVRFCCSHSERSRGIPW